MPKEIKRWNSFSVTNTSSNEAKFTYIILNSQTPCPPRGAVPVNQGRCGRFFTLNARIVFGHGCDRPNYVGAKYNFIQASAMAIKPPAPMSKRLGPEHYGEDRQESQVEKAERVVREELRWRRRTETTLAERKKGEIEKVKIAIRLRNETLVTVAWIAERLRMGSVANVNTLLYHWRQGKHEK